MRLQLISEAQKSDNPRAIPPASHDRRSVLQRPPYSRVTLSIAPEVPLRRDPKVPNRELPTASAAERHRPEPTDSFNDTEHATPMDVRLPASPIPIRQLLVTIPSDSRHVDRPAWISPALSSQMSCKAGTRSLLLETPLSLHSQTPPRERRRPVVLVPATPSESMRSSFSSEVDSQLQTSLVCNLMRPSME
jgi:hypothetical protein